MNITMTEWEATKAKLVVGLMVRWPWLVREDRRNEVRVETAVMTASADIRFLSSRGSATVDIRVDSSGCATGGLVDIAEAARQICEVRDAMLYVYGETANLTIWRDGECPCGFCGGRGEDRGGTCKRCGGKGKR